MNGYTCVVCIKQVPDTKKVTGQAMKADGTINRAALPAIFNPEDKNALEAALSVKERYGGKVIAIAMGLPAATAILREALACGADEAVLVTDRKAAGSDTLATSYILSQAVKKFNPDLVFCGRQAIDGDTAQTGPQIGEKLDCAVVTYLEKLEIDGDTAIATRDIGTGVETCRAKLPALFTVTEKFGELRPFEMRRLAAKTTAAASPGLRRASTRSSPSSSRAASSRRLPRPTRESAALLPNSSRTTPSGDCSTFQPFNFSTL